MQELVISASAVLDQKRVLEVAQHESRHGKKLEDHRISCVMEVPGRGDGFWFQDVESDLAVCDAELTTTSH
jgi:hypothetical protein